MHVLATAGHVDHGKSTLVRALTGMEPDRYAEERRRGLTLDLGFAWMDLADGQRLVLVDVPGHERFVGTMLAGAGPVPAVLLVVAADGGWSAQTQEHVAILDALGIEDGLVVVTRSDLADPGPLLDEVPEWLAGTSLASMPAVSCSAITGAGMDDLRRRLADVVAALPVPDTEAPTRLWIDRSFTIRGAGTVVTGTLPAGRLRVDDELILARTGQTVTVRGLQSMNEPVPDVAAIARVAVNLRGVSANDLRRGDALLTPGSWAVTKTADLQLVSAASRLPREMTLHIGAAAIPTRTRRLGDRGVRLSVAIPVALSYRDRVLLRDPGSRTVIGADVLDPLPRPLPHRRGAAARRGGELIEMSAGPDPDGELRRRGFERVNEFSRLGIGRPSTEPIGGWYLDPGTRAELTQRLALLAADHQRSDPLDAGLTAGAAARLLGLPDARLLSALAGPPWQLRAGRVITLGLSEARLPLQVEAKIQLIRNRLRDNAFDAPTSSELAELDVSQAMLKAAVRAGLLLAVGDGVFLGTDAPAVAVQRLAELAQPFSTSQARTALRSSRRVALALLQWLDTAAVTVRLPDDRRQLRGGEVSRD